MVEFGTSSSFRGWVRVLGHGFEVRGTKVKSRNCALASDLVRALILTSNHKIWYATPPPLPSPDAFLQVNLGENGKR